MFLFVTETDGNITNLKSTRMRNRSVRLATAGAALVFLSFACEKTQLPEPEQESGSKKPELVLKAAGDVQGRNLAANCFQCHGTNGHAGELKIAGQGADGIVNDLNSMKNQPVGDNIMNVHARAYTDAEIRLIADFISKQ